MKTRGYLTTKTGLSRSTNEDSALIDDELGLYVVCDGMGAHAAGEIASSLACREIQRFVAQAITDNEAPSKTTLEQAFLAACKKIFEHGDQTLSTRGMGTTATAVLIRGTVCWLAHVGDSRAYLVRGRTINQLTKDHTFVAELIEQGVFTSEQASKSPFGHILTRALGTEPAVVIDSLRVEVLPGDRILLCSDGVVPGVSSVPLRADNGFERYQAGELATSIVDAALGADSQDDLTALEVVIPLFDSAEREARLNLTYDTLTQMYLFEELKFSELTLIIEYMRVRSVAAGERVITRGDIGREMYVILEGHFKAEEYGLSLVDLLPGNHFGEMSLLSGRPRATDIRAVTDGTLLELSYNDFRRIVEKESIIGMKLYRALAVELSERYQFVGLAFPSTP